MPARIGGQNGCLKLVAGFLVAFAIFQAAAQMLGSDRGQAGVLVAAIVIGALLLIEYALFREARLRRCTASAGSTGEGSPSRLH